ncbi:OmpH family outer membrane protein [uncultured Lacinutrix sp.]|uniref:OmpH family outer membrane protein n=1 Tax=uncultured Lacinutrix sp. TaxID=574032 RepID=UPI00261ED813|nr:OmpH family outer membrane protein [uncultured Lacinutrix sp.]
MKKIKTLLIAASLFIGATSFTNAQSKVAHINTTDLIKAMPAMKTAQADMERVGKTYQADIEAMKKDLKTKTDLFEAQANTKTQEENEKRYLEVQTDNQSIQQYAANAQQQLQKKELELLKPITDKAKAAILKVAKAQGFDYVLDSSPQTGVIMAEGKDLLADVKKELGF